MPYFYTYLLIMKITLRLHELKLKIGTNWIKEQYLDKFLCQLDICWIFDTTAMKQFDVIWNETIQ